MRCLVVADLHYSLPQLDWLVSAGPQFDLVIFAGDALDIGSMVDFRAQIVVVKKYLALLAAKTRVILCSGNHDLEDRKSTRLNSSHDQISYAVFCLKKKKKKKQKNKYILKHTQQ